MKTLPKIPNWLAFKTYRFGYEDSKTIISNEYKHEYVLLDGLSSDLWNILVNAHISDEILVWAKKNGVIEELDNFIEQLKQQGLILDDVKSGITQTQLNTNIESNENETIQLENDMKNWCFEHGFLYSIFVELTYSCNLKCIHCYNPKHMNNVQIDFDNMKKIIDDAYEIGCFKITFSGGECTLDKDFLKIVEYARKKRLSVEIYTNGQSLYDNKEIFDKIKNLYPYRIGLSLYSLDENIHDKITGTKGSCKKTIECIKQLRENNIYVQIKNFLLSINYQSCIEVKNFAKSINASCGTDLSLIPTIEGNKKTLLLEVKENELFDLFSNSKSPLYSKNVSLKEFSKIKNATPCYAGFSGVSISPKLEVHPCVSLPINLGNLKETSLKDIWENALNKNPESKLYQWQQVTFKDLKECYKEDYCAFCAYCPGMGMLENGFLKKSDVLCRQAKAKQKAYQILNK